MNKKLGIMIITLAMVMVGSVLGVKLSEENTQETANNVENVMEENKNLINGNVVVTEETKGIVNETIEAGKSGQDLSTTEEFDGNGIDENELEVDALVEQENISYGGTSIGEGYDLLGAYQGLTYYSQADSRWANVLYTSTNNSSQTIKSSGCRSNCSCNCGIKFKGSNITNNNGKFSS